MKNIMLALAVVAVASIFTGCTSLRTPKEGPRAEKVYYNTFMGISIESALYGDGIIPGSTIQ